MKIVRWRVTIEDRTGAGYGGKLTRDDSDDLGASIAEALTMMFEDYLWPKVIRDMILRLREYGLLEQVGGEAMETLGRAADLLDAKDNTPFDP